MAKTLAVVMAAGKGTRMKSELPKVLVPVCGRPMIDYVIDALEAAGVEQIVVVVGYRADDVRAALAARRNVVFALQAEQRGTGHAVMCAREHLAGHAGPVFAGLRVEPRGRTAGRRATPPWCRGPVPGGTEASPTPSS